MSGFQSPSENHIHLNNVGKSFSEKKSTVSSNGNKIESNPESGPAAFFRRLQRGVTDTVSGVAVAGARPIPGVLKMNSNHATPGAKQSNSQGDRIQSNSALNALDSFPTGHINSSSSKSSAEMQRKSTLDKKASSYRIALFDKVLQSETVDLKALRRLSWNGVPSDYRTEVWQMLLGYLPLNKERRESAIIRKRKEFQDSIPVYYNVSEADRTTQEGELLRQILVDMPRTCPNTPFFHQVPIQRAMERILYIWAIRHPASGYVQGMSDLLTPLFVVCVQPFAADPLRCDVASLDAAVLADIEADVYWCFSKLLDNIQDHYTFSQPGLQRMVLRLEDLVHRLDSELHKHFMTEGIQYMQFSFRWMNCLLLRELPLRAIMRVWDTYLSEEEGGFENFHVYVSVVFLKTYRDKLLSMQFQEILMFLQDLPTVDWAEDAVEPILSQAYILSTLFENSPSHLN
mmetsp:Transcript_22823/g.31302  ORF Transcript_22823/g.31302 Transcript_22823/m.31302 type:complete len:458 (+) Transcript_22823:52-1425(+)